MPVNHRSKAIKYLSTEEIAALFKAIDSVRDRAIFRLAYHRGLRASEVGLLQLADFRVREGRMAITRLKGSNSGEHRLTDEELKAVRAWVKERGTKAGALFISRDHKPISRGRLAQLMAHYCRLAGIPEDKAHMHALKHSCGTHLLEKGVEITQVQDWLGHRNIQNTMVYAAITNRSRDEVAERLKGWK